MSRTFTLDSIHKTYISQISLFTFKKNAQPQVKKSLVRGINYTNAGALRIAWAKWGGKVYFDSHYHRHTCS